MTTQLVPVFTGELSGVSIQLVDARLLHGFLEVATQFKDWIARRIEEYSFIDGKDFCSILSKTKGRPSKEYHLTIDMAKELSMVERNEKGKQARRYFIDMERKVLLDKSVLSCITEAEAQQFKKSMENHCKYNGKKYSELYRMVYDYFGITSYKNIPNGKLSEACQVCGMELIPLSRPKIIENKTPINLPAPTVDKLDCASARNTLDQLKQLHKDQESITRLEHLERCYIKAWTEMDESIFRLELALGMLRRWRTTL